MIKPKQGSEPGIICLIDYNWAFRVDNLSNIQVVENHGKGRARLVNGNPFFDQKY